MTAEEEAKEDKPKRPPTPKELREKAKEQEADGLCNPASRYLFIKWYSLGGPQRGISFTELLQSPAWLLEDFGLLMTYISDERDKAKRSKPPKPKMGKRR